MSATQIILRRRARKARKHSQTTRTRIWSAVWFSVSLVLIVAPLLVLIGGAAIVYTESIDGLPTPVETTFLDSAGITRLVDSSGTTTLFSVSDPLGSSREWTRLNTLPQHIIDATLIVEDSDFLSATSFDPAGTLVRLWRNIMEGPIEAESSLTARLVRNVIAAQPEIASAQDRGREIALIAEINRRYTPSEVLEWHLNTNYYGSEAYGIEAAAQVYLGKSARDVTLDEAALLASIPTAPQFNPFDDLAAARGRQNDTLRRMLTGGIITQEIFDSAAAIVTPVRSGSALRPDIAPDYSLYARKQAEQILNALGFDGGRMVSRGGLTITTAMDLRIQFQAECALNGHLANLAGRTADWRTADGSVCAAQASLQRITPLTGDAPDTGSVTVINVQTGELTAMAGPANRADSQPGQTLAPFVIFEGFRERQQNIIYTPASMLLDIPRRFPGASEGLIYQPANANGQFSGPVSLREAVARSLLPPLVQIADNHGMTGIVRTARRLGINTLNDGQYTLSLFEREGAVAPLDIAYAYTVFGSLGTMSGIQVPPRAVGLRNRDPVAVLKITDAGGAVLWEYNPSDWRVNIFSDAPELGYLVNSVFSDPSIRLEEYGSSSPFTPQRPTAIVHSLTSNGLDDWTAGYTTNLSVAVHLARSDRTAMSLPATSTDGAAVLWRTISDTAHANLPITDWQRPQNVVEANVCERSGLLPNGVCPTRREVFIANIQPLQQDTYWQAVELNAQTGQLATASTSAANRITEMYFIPPDSALDWWRANRQKLPPTDFDTTSMPDNSPFAATRITRPERYTWLTGQVEIRGNLPATMSSYQLAYGAGLNPTQWNNIGEQQTSLLPDGILGIWDTVGLDGIYTLRLSALRADNTREISVVQVTIDNLPPSISLSAGERDKIYRFPADTLIPIRVDVADNLGIARVEIYHEGRLVATLDSAPYEYTHEITSVGTETFEAAVFDIAGNRSTSTALSVEVVR